MLTNLGIEPSVGAVPFVLAIGEGLRLAMHGAPLFRGVELLELGLTFSVELRVEVVPTDTSFEQRPAVRGLLSGLALKSVGSTSTNRADARRFAAFLNTEAARNFGDDPEFPLVALTGVVDGFEMVPVIPWELKVAGMRITVDALAFDPEAATFTAAGTGALSDPAEHE